MSNINLNEEITNRKFCIEDVKVIFERNGIKFTENNIKKFFTYNRISEILKKDPITHGWGIVEDMLLKYDEELEKVDDKE